MRGNAGFFGLSMLFFGYFLFVETSTTLNVTRSVSEFSSDLYNFVSKGESSNVIISPFSVYISVALLLMAARNQTAQEIANGLKLNGTNTNTQIADGIHEFLVCIQSNSTLTVATKIFSNNDGEIDSDFIDVARDKFQSEVASLDFSQREESVNIINDWVKEKTNDKIKDLITVDILRRRTSMILVNAIYFKASWKYRFNKEHTRQDKFYRSNTKFVMVDMMYIETVLKFGFFMELNARGVSLPYKNSNMSMFIILPNERTGLAQLESRLKDVDLQNLQKNMTETEVQVFLPKFKIEFQVCLRNALRKMGMENMFKKSADFVHDSGLTNSYINEIIHKAFIEVDEDGTEVAAATVAYARAGSPALKMDRPFFFAIGTENNFLFMGKYLHKAQ